MEFCLSAVVAFETMKYEFGERCRSGRLPQDRAITPLRKVDWPGNGMQNWMFSDQVAPTSDYWRRWVFIKDGKVVDLVSDYWWD